MRISNNAPEVSAILTPTQATSVPMLLRKGIICLPFVTVLSRLGLKASPEKKVRRAGWSAYLGARWYWLMMVWKRVVPPMGSADPDLDKGKGNQSVLLISFFSVPYTTVSCV